MPTKPKRPIRDRPNNGPLSLHPLKFEDAVSALLKAKPEPKQPKKVRKMDKRAISRTGQSLPKDFE
jgi:hypothetical protein